MAFAVPSHNIEPLELGPGMKVVDLGAGSGFYAILAARRVGQTGKIYAIDLTASHLSRIRSEARKEKLHNIETVVADLDHEKLGFSDFSMDAAIISNILFLLSDREHCLTELGRVLKPRSLVLLIDWKESFGGVWPPKNKVITPGKAIALFSQKGFRALKEFDAGEHHYGLIFR